MLIQDPSKRLTIADMVEDIMKSDEFAMVYLYWKLLGRDPDTVRAAGAKLAGREASSW